MTQIQMCLLSSDGYVSSLRHRLSRKRTRDARAAAHVADAFRLCSSLPIRPTCKLTRQRIPN